MEYIDCLEWDSITSISHTMEISNIGFIAVHALTEAMVHLFYNGDTGVCDINVFH